MESKLVLYNTLTRRKEVFEPLTPGRVGMYVCGPTVYGDPHLGHARPAVTFDLMFRYLKSCGYKVRYVRNITDGAPGARRRRGGGQDRQEGAPRAAGADGGGALLYGALPPCDGCAQRRDPVDRTLCLGAYHRADRVRQEDPRRRLCLRVERLGLFRRGEIQRQI